MKLSVPIYKQGDPRWGGLKLGTSSYTLASDGCTITCMAMLARYYGKDTDPARFDQATVNVQGFVNGSLYVWASVTKIYSDIVFTQIKEYPFDPAPIADIKQQITNGRPVLAWVDQNPRQAGNQMHWVLVIGYTDTDLIINDPLYGDEVFFKARYGDPVKQILGHRFYTGPVPQTPKDLQAELDKMRGERDKNWNLYQEAEAKALKLSQELEQVKAERNRLVDFRNGVEELCERFTR